MYLLYTIHKCLLHFFCRLCSENVYAVFLSLSSVQVSHLVKYLQSSPAWHNGWNFGENDDPKNRHLSLVLIKTWAQFDLFIWLFMFVSAHCWLIGRPRERAADTEEPGCSTLLFFDETLCFSFYMLL